jgi:SAM-dependent methyltransferase
MLRPFLRRHFVPIARRLPPALQEPLREIWRAFAPRAIAHTGRIDDDAYRAHIENETAIFAGQDEVHDLPPIAHYWSDKYLRPKLETFGFSNPDEFFAVELERAYRAAVERPARFISIGAGNCDTEVRLACRLRERGIVDFTIECLELNRAMRERGTALARAAGVEAQVIPLEGDFNRWRPQRRYDAAIANQSLHHVVNLEGLFDAIAAALTPQGIFVTSDMIGRNGHQRWPEALAIVREFWRELPMNHRYNLQLRRREKNFRDWDCSREGFEGVRAQDILPLLIERFDFDFFLAYSNLIDPFIDRSFGPHFDADSERDRSFIDRVQARDEADILSGHISPTHMLAAMRRKMRTKTNATSEHVHMESRTMQWKHLSPQFCLRDPQRCPASQRAETQR